MNRSEAFSNNKYYIEIIVILALVVDLFIKMLPVIPIGIIILVYLAVRCNKWERVFMFLMYYPWVVGYVLGAVGYSGLGGWFKVIAVIMVIYMIATNQKPMRNAWRAILPFGLLMIFFSVSVLLTTGGDYSLKKLSNTFIDGSLAIIAFLIFFTKQREFDISKMGVFYILISALLLRMSLFTDNISGPSKFLDFGFLRIQQDIFDTDSFHIGYQNIGFVCVQGLAFYLMTLKTNIDVNRIIIPLLGALIILYCGSRQAILSVFIIFILWFIQLRNKKNNAGIRTVVIVGGLVLMSLLMQILVSDEGVLYSVASEGYVEGGSRGLHLMRGIELFEQNPVFGVGFGRFDMWGEYGVYPHNIIVEILAEMGIVGLVLIFVLLLNCIFKNRKAFMFILFLFMALFLRSMASGGLDSNIILFSLLFAMPAFKMDISPYMVIPTMKRHVDLNGKN